MSKHKAQWIGPDKRVPDLGETFSAGDSFEFDDSITLAGEDTDYRITGGPEHSKLTKKAKDQSISGHTKMSRKELAEALEAKAAEEKAADNDDDQEA